MSTRFYPLYQRGNPQLRVFLPNFWMKIVKPRSVKVPPNIVHFQVSPEMTKFDVKNYLEKIYKVPVLDVKNINLRGKVHANKLISKEKNYYKDDDYKMAYVTLPKDYSFEIPEVTKNADTRKDGKDRMTEDIDKMKAEYLKSTLKGTRGRNGLPNFFGL